MMAIGVFNLPAKLLLTTYNKFGPIGLTASGEIPNGDDIPNGTATEAISPEPTDSFNFIIKSSSLIIYKDLSNERFRFCHTKIAQLNRI